MVTAGCNIDPKAFVCFFVFPFLWWEADRGKGSGNGYWTPELPCRPRGTGNCAEIVTLRAAQAGPSDLRPILCSRHVPHVQGRSSSHAFCSWDPSILLKTRNPKDLLIIWLICASVNISLIQYKTEKF